MARLEEGGTALETASLIALLRNPKRRPAQYADLVEEAGGAQAVLNDEQGLLAAELATAALSELTRWSEQRIRAITVLDTDYPENLRAVHDRPPLIFLAGELRPRDKRAVAVIGSRRASAAGIQRARATTEALAEAGCTIVSGLASGIDTEAHAAALDNHARTIAVIGTGLRHCYPAENAELQRRIAESGAVVSQFWPDQGPNRHTFPARNAVMSGVSLATVIVEAGRTSGARIQARRALSHGRPVLLLAELLNQDWARELAARPGTHVVRSPADVVAVIESASSTEAPVAW